MLSWSGRTSSSAVWRSFIVQKPVTFIRWPSSSLSPASDVPREMAATVWGSGRVNTRGKWKIGPAFRSCQCFCWCGRSSSWLSPSHLMVLLLFLTPSGSRTDDFPLTCYTNCRMTRNSQRVGCKFPEPPMTTTWGSPRSIATSDYVSCSSAHCTNHEREGGCGYEAGGGRSDEWSLVVLEGRGRGEETWK